MNDLWYQFTKSFITLWKYELFTLGGAKFTAATIFLLLSLSMVVLTTGRYFRKWIVARLLGRTHLHESLQYSIAKIVHYVYVVIGLFIALQIVGITMSSLTVLLGAIGVGVGFGLQNIVNNFVSGLVILVERPINMGDRVEIGNVAGKVVRIGGRSTTVTTNDNISIIVPNANLITETVTNWSLGDPTVRFRIPINVAYGSDVDKVKTLLLQVAEEHPATLKTPPPTVYFDGFGDNGIQLELAVWTSEMTHNPRRFRSDLNFAIERKFRENKIEIPYPQRDLRMR